MAKSKPKRSATKTRAAAKAPKQAKGRTTRVLLIATFDVSKLTPREVDALTLEVTAQAEASDNEGYTHPDVEVSFKTVRR
jgi:hypothetical protein